MKLLSLSHLTFILSSRRGGVFEMEAKIHYKLSDRTASYQGWKDPTHIARLLCITHICDLRKR